MAAFAKYVDSALRKVLAVTLDGSSADGTGQPPVVHLAGLAQVRSERLALGRGRGSLGWRLGGHVGSTWWNRQANNWAMSVPRLLGAACTIRLLPRHAVPCHDTNKMNPAMSCRAVPQQDTARTK